MGAEFDYSKLLQDFEHGSSSLGVSTPSVGQLGIGVVDLYVPLLTFQGSSPFLLGAQWPLGMCQFPPGLAPPSSCATHFSGTTRKFWAGRCVPRQNWQEVG